MRLDLELKTVCTDKVSVMKKTVLVLTFIIFSFEPALASSGLGMLLGFSEDKTTLASNDSQQTAILQLTTSYQLKSRGRFYIGADYLLTNSTQPVLNAASGNEKILSSTFFLTAKMSFGHEENFTVTGLFSPYSQLQKETPNLETDLWSGTGYGAKLSFEPKISKPLRLNVSFNYMFIKYSSKNQNSNLNSATSFDRSLWFPTLGLVYQFN